MKQFVWAVACLLVVWGCGDDSSLLGRLEPTAPDCAPRAATAAQAYVARYPN